MSGNDWNFYERHFGQPRLRHYLADSGGDPTVAANLYDWNVAVSAAFWEALAYFEVAFRNAIDARMDARHTHLGRSGHWIFDDHHEFGRGLGTARHRQPYRDVDEAIRRVRANGKPVIAGQVISELPFGFWHQMISRRQMVFWPDVAGAFPFAPNRAQPTVQAPIGRIRALRNRIGHHHRIWSEDVSGRYDDLLVVAGYIDPDLRSFIDGHSRVRQLLSVRP